LIYLGEIPDYQSINKHILSMDGLFVRFAKAYFNNKQVMDYPKKLESLAAAIDHKMLPAAIRGRDNEAIAIMQLYDKESLQDPIFDGLLSSFRADKTYYDKVVSNMTPLLEQLNTGRTAELLAPDYYDLEDPREIFDWKSVIEQNAVVYVGLDCLTDSIVGGAVGASMFSDLTSTLGSIYKSPESIKRICLHADEFAELLGDQFIPLANKGGGAGLQITAYTQTSADLTVGIGNADKARQIAGNFNNLLVLRVKNKETAEFLTEQLPQVQVAQLTTVTSARDSSDVESETHFTSTNEDRITTENVPLLSPSELIALPKGQAFLFTEGNLYKVRVPFSHNDKDLPDTLETIAAAMKESYLNATPEDWFRHSEQGSSGL
jgi:conjugative coupling factor TraD (SXT/TOL subfamily)